MCIIQMSAEIKTHSPIKITNEIQNKTEQYGLTQQLFDPFSSSPPNSFMSNLKRRMSVYEFFMKDAIRNSE
jgi:hypothetical protein